MLLPPYVVAFLVTLKRLADNTIYNRHKKWYIMGSKSMYIYNKIKGVLQMLSNSINNVPMFYVNVYNLLKNTIGCDEWGTCASAVQKVRQPEVLADEEFLMFIFSPQNNRIKDAINTRYKRIELYTGIESKLIELRYQVVNNVTETVVKEEYFVPSTPAEAIAYINDRLL